MKFWFKFIIIILYVDVPAPSVEKIILHQILCGCISGASILFCWSMSPILSQFTLS